MSDALKLGQEYMKRTHEKLSESGNLHLRKHSPSIVEHPELVEYGQKNGVRPTDAQKRHLERVDQHPLAIMCGEVGEANFLALLCKMMQAKKVIEVGTFLGFTSLVLAESCPDVQITTIDFSPEVVAVAKQGWADAGVADRIDSRIGTGESVLNELLETEGESSYDFCFIDADKHNYDVYYEKALVLVRSGGLICVDNTFWFGRPCDETIQDEDTVAIRALNKKINQDSRVDISMVPFADGVTVCLKK